MSELSQAFGFEQQDLEQISRRLDERSLSGFEEEADRCLVQLIESVMPGLPVGTHKEEVLAAGTAGKLTEVAKKGLAREALGGKSGVPIRFRPEMVDIEGGMRLLPPTTIMVLVESSPVFGVDTERMDRGMEVLHWAGRLNSQEAIQQLVPEVTTPETLLVVQMIERGVRGTAEDLVLVESGEEVERTVLPLYVSANYDTSKRAGVAMNQSSFEDSVERFAARVEREGALGRFVIPIVALDRQLRGDLIERQLGLDEKSPGIRLPFIYRDLSKYRDVIAVT